MYFIMLKKLCKYGGVVRPTKIINLEEKVVDKTGEMKMIKDETLYKFNRTQKLYYAG